LPAAQDHITAATPMGATVVHGGVTIRVRAARAESVHVSFHVTLTIPANAVLVFTPA
jgi:hypothetical protein